VFASGCALGLVVPAVNLLGDGLRDLLDPRHRGGGEMSQMKQPVLSVRDLTTSFRPDPFTPWKSVIRKVSFDIAAGETLAIVGESGSGKSVTSLSVMRLLPARSSRTEGTVLLEGCDLLALPEAEMRRVRGGDMAMIFQEPMTSLNPIMTSAFWKRSACRTQASAMMPIRTSCPVASASA
jgi:ABC-type glutathione transport system ATPase component